MKKELKGLLHYRPKRKCKFCTSTFRGRFNKIFCSTTCKTRYHHDLRRKTRKVSAHIDNILHRNRSILYEIMGEQTIEKRIKKSVLDKKKFQFGYYTSQESGTEKPRFYLYDFSYMLKPDNQIVIQRVII